MLGSAFGPPGNDYPKVALSNGLSLILDSYEINEIGDEIVPINKSFGRIVACNVNSRVNIPSRPASIVDGFAVSISKDDQSREFIVVGQSLAGDVDFEFQLKMCQAVYVTTGGVVPNGATCVVPIEQCTIVDDTLQISVQADVCMGLNIRTVGSDTCIDSLILPKGCVVGSSEIALLTGCFVTEVPVLKKLRIAIVSTGAEIASGQVADVNRAYLLSRFEHCTDLSSLVTVCDLGVVEDDLEAFESILSDSQNQWDILITTGGLSKGKTDYWKTALENLKFEILFGQLDLKPGKPTTVAYKNSKHIFCLPGNPASCFVTFNLIVCPVICHKRFPQNSAISVSLTRNSFPIKPDLDRPEYLRATLYIDSNGTLTASISNEHQRSSRIASCANQINALVCIPPGSSVYDENTDQLFGAFLLPGHTPEILAGSSTKISPFAKAKAFDKLVSWLKTRTDVENISLMNLVGFCRNCLAKWLPAPLKDSQQYVYGMDYETWKTMYRKGEKREHSDHKQIEHTTSNPCASSMNKRTAPIPLFVLTISDRAHAKVYPDLSGPKIIELIPNSTVIDRHIVPDELDAIQSQIRLWTNSRSNGLIVTTGGTGLSRRDLTRAAVLPLIHKHATGIEQYLSNVYSNLNPLFALSNPTIGTIDQFLIVTLPGRPEAVEQGLAALVPLLPKILDELAK